MSWKKNTFGYLMWFVYSMITAVCLVCLAIYLLRDFGESAGILVGGGILGLLGFAVFFIHRFLAGREKSGNMSKQCSMAYLVAESLLVVVLLVAGVLLRVFSVQGHLPLLLPQQTGDSVFFEAAMVTQEQTIPQVVHGVVYLYIQLLHLVCLLFGNKITACIVLQIVMQVLAFLFLYLGARKIAGRAAAVLSFSILMLSPSMISGAYTLSPESLALLLFAVVFLFSSGLSAAGNIVEFFAAGVLTGLVLYLDVTGILLFAFICALLFCRRGTGTDGQCDENPFKESVKRMLLCILGIVVSFFIAIAVDSLLSGKAMGGVLKAWGLVFCPEGFRLTGVFITATAAESILLLICLAIGIFSFWCRKKEERMSVWVLMLLLLGAARLFDAVGTEMPGEMLFFSLLAVCAAIGVQEAFAVSAVVEEAEPAGLEAAEPIPESPCVDADIPKIPPEEDLQEINLDAPPRRSLPKREIQYIENPLPLPKKHEKRVMDYKVKDAGTDDFDIATEADDDFDI